RKEEGGRQNILFLQGDEPYHVKFAAPSHMPTKVDLRWNFRSGHANEMVLGSSSGSMLYWFDVVANKVTRSWDFSTLNPPRTIQGLGMSKGNTSFDGRFIALSDSTGKMFIVDMDPQSPFSQDQQRIGPVYDLSADNIPYTVSTVSLSPSGKYVLVHYIGDYLRVFDVNPTTLALTPRKMQVSYPGQDGSPDDGFIYEVGHLDMTLDPFDNNEDVVVGQEHARNVESTIPGIHTFSRNGIGHVVKVRLRDNRVVSLTDPGTKTTNGLPKEAAADHISAQNTERLGWVYVSYFNKPGLRFDDEIVALKIDGSGTVERLAHSHSDNDNNNLPEVALDSDFGYRSETHPVPSLDGKRVMFASNWLYNSSGTQDRQGIQDYIIDTR
ncbi:MAG TPA: hypothetical protein VLG69_04445, partial [Candidatus Andersenbacteria bacterium]|nr:hypothetical protein [Candidatus Andersenbacteria bacterium]